MLDEAWKVASDDRSDAITIIREGRKYQFGLIVASQNPTDINEAIFSNVGTTIMFRIKFEKFIDYLQGSLNFSNFIRSEIGKLGVGQAAVDMSFNTAVKFPNIFMVEKVVGEVPLDTYSISIAEILTQEEISGSMEKEYTLDKVTLNSKFVESGLSSGTINHIFGNIGLQGAAIDIRALVQILEAENINRNTIVAVMRSIGLSDAIIGRVFMYAPTKES